MLGLVLSGATAIPLATELNCLVKWTGADRIAQKSDSLQGPAWSIWLRKVHSSLNDTSNQNPFLYYGTDWLAFGHFAIALAFVGALIDPVRNQWLFNFGLMACMLVVPYALIFGAIRGIPLWWRLVDCSFGVFGMVPLILCRHRARELEQLRGRSLSSVPASPGSAGVSPASSCTVPGAQ
jgi:hypothetical protein